ncbi:hypothetical protein HHE94_01810 [Pseudoalteromonas arctica]|uniref:Uncharacterized protein n=1 Tax=Pseudoalteromonas arctica TaxID=394751 RepID=A0AAP7CIY7_9GAMM|nr:hypothetical protein [Pseudoalteromonas arctica]NMP01462.1 hypothetical protein [Pseudoalteromonas arctica]
MKSIETLPLHDAILNTININWENRSVIFNLNVFTVKGGDALSHQLTFENASNIEVPHNSPWGDSIFINGVSIIEDNYEIEIQSGDVIKITAEKYSFSPVSS